MVSVAQPPSPPSLREVLGDEIFEIFTEEVSEICQNLTQWYPRWEKDRHNRELLTDIRRAFHTLKGSGRMAGAFALGDLAWAHEDLLNQVIGGQLAANDYVLTQVHRVIDELVERETFYQQAQQKDDRVEQFVQAAQAIMRHEPLPNFTQTTAITTPPENAQPHTESAWLQDDTTPPTDTTPESFADSEAEEVIDFSSKPMPSTLATLTFVKPDTSNTPEPSIAENTGAAFPITSPETLTPSSAVPPPPQPALNMPEDDSESRLVWQLFWEEFPEQLQALDRHLQTLYDNPASPETIRELEREFHTLKGGARMAQLTALADVSHDAESLLSRLSRSQPVGETELSAIQQAVDTLHTLAEQYKNLTTPLACQAAPSPALPSVPQDAAPTSVQETVATITPSSETSSPTAELPIELRSEPESLAAALAQRGLQEEFGSLLERMLAEQAESLPDISVLDTTTRPITPPTNALDSITNTNTNTHETIRLPATFVDGLIERAVGLNVQQVRMSEHLSSMGMDVEELVRTVARLRQQIRALELESEAQIHDGRAASASRSAAQKRGETFDPLEMDQYAEIQRISRSLAESLNDLVNLEADLASQVRKGEQLLQDDMRTTRQLQQELLNTRLVALTVLIPRLRRLTRQTAGELGKQVALEVEGEDCELDRNLLQHMTGPLEHMIRNSVSHGIESPEERVRNGKPAMGKITLNVSRDDAEIVIRFKDDGRGLDKQRLLQKALEKGLVSSAQELSDSELERLILRPGFSTATTVNQIAGRGIGMDVVYSELKALGGNLQIHSQFGHGVEFTLRLPFTLVVNPVLLAEVQGQIYAIPMNGIQGLARLTGQQLQEGLNDPNARVEFAGQLYYLRQLSEQLGQSTVPQEFAADERFPVVFIHLQGQTVAWVIDRVRGRREVVLQPLGTLFRNCHLYSAATVSPDGRVFLVPDMAELARRTLAGQEETTETITTAETSPDNAGPPRVMVVDDSITVRRVTEKFLTSQHYVVATAKDGMEALEQVGDFAPNVILLDIEMPRMDGFELLGHLRRDARWATLPVIMISSRTAQKHREHAASLGATGFLGKPYQNEVLLEALQEVLASGHEPNNQHVQIWEALPA